MILAAGRGARLRPLTDMTPKPLIPLNHQPLISYSLRLLQKHGIQDVLINLHYLGDLIEKELGDGKKFGMNIRYSWEPEVLGTGGGVKKAQAFFAGQPSLILNSDILIDLDLDDFFRYHRKKKGLATMALRPREAGSSYSSVVLDEDNRILKIETDASPRSGASFMYTGVQLLEPGFFDYLPANRAACLIREGYQPALANQEKIFGYVYQGYWNDVGTFESYRQAENDLASVQVNWPHKSFHTGS